MNHCFVSKVLYKYVCIFIEYCVCMCVFSSNKIHVLCVSKAERERESDRICMCMCQQQSMPAILLKMFTTMVSTHTIYIRVYYRYHLI